MELEIRGTGGARGSGVVEPGNFRDQGAGQFGAFVRVVGVIRNRHFGADAGVVELTTASVVGKYRDGSVDEILLGVDEVLGGRIGHALIKVVGEYLRVGPPRDFLSAVGLRNTVTGKGVHLGESKRRS